MEIKDWDVSAPSNNFAAPDGFPEGMNYSDVNNSAREIMAVLSRWAKDTDGSLVSTGSAGNYVLVPNRTISTLVDGLSLRFRANHTNTTNSASLDIGFGATLMRTPLATQVDTGMIVSGRIYDVAYSSSQSRWIVLGGLNQATETTPGIGEIANNSEALAGVSDSLLMTPLKSKALIDQTVNIVRKFASFSATGGTVSSSVTNGITSIVRNSVGNYTVTFSSAFADVNYMAMVSHKATSSTIAPVRQVTKAVGTYRFITLDLSGNPVDSDACDLLFLK